MDKKFFMQLNTHVDQVLSVVVDKKNYPLSIAGLGIPCLLIGLSSLVMKTLSENFRKFFQIYSSDLYWDSNHKLDDPISLTMSKIFDDLAALISILKLKPFVIFGHSAYGIVALEFAKEYP